MWDHNQTELILFVEMKLYVGYALEASDEYTTSKLNLPVNCMLEIETDKSKGKHCNHI